ncbi:MAG: hypothetical protein CFE37_13870 [Alphaproteobacteria bacterium PA4]|nr:MAG: hypothetical protein CFE37_13870 [Alphaproteobacteria bacterium PA4]
MLDTLGRPARLRYLSGSYQLLSPGDFVTCAVTGKRIPLQALRYWSHEFQEAYVDAAAATIRYAEKREKGEI